MQPIGRGLFMAVLAAGASTAQALPSPCANLPTSGPVGGTGTTEVSVPPTRRLNGTLKCPDRFRLVVSNGLARCVGLAGAVVMGNPRAQCYAAMPFGVPQPGSIPQYTRGRVPSCPAVQRADIMLRGSNIGFDDVVFTPVPAPGTTVTPLRASGPQVPTQDDPALNQCPPTSCIKLRLAFAPNAADSIAIRIAVPGRSFDYPIRTVAQCPRPVLENRSCPPLAGPYGGTRTCP